MKAQILLNELEKARKYVIEKGFYRGPKGQREDKRVYFEIQEDCVLFYQGNYYFDVKVYPSLLIGWPVYTGRQIFYKVNKTLHLFKKLKMEVHITTEKNWLVFEARNKRQNSFIKLPRPISSLDLKKYWITQK